MDTSPALFCPACKLKNETTAITCVHCGARLPTATSGRLTTKKVASETTLFSTDELKKSAGIPEDGISILSQETGQEIAVMSEKKFILGRKMEGSTEIIVDLSAFGAYGLGVSRMHVLIHLSKNGYEICDLESTNGTWLNEERLEANKYYSLPSGSRLRLGKMYLMVLHGK